MKTTEIPTFLLVWALVPILFPPFTIVNKKNGDRNSELTAPQFLQWYKLRFGFFHRGSEGRYQ